MCFVFVVVHPAVSDLEHVRIVPVARRCPRSQFVLRKTDGGHGVPSVADVARRSPSICSYLGAPFPHLGTAILAKAIEYGAPSFEKRIAHDLIQRAHLLVGVRLRAP